MDLAAYLSAHDLTQKAFAARLKVSAGLVSQWLSGETKITGERAVQIENATNGVVTRGDLRPDLYRAAAAGDRNRTDPVEAGQAA